MEKACKTFFLKDETKFFPYGLYFPDEIKAAGCEVLKHLNDLPELKDNWSDEQKFSAIEKIYLELSDSSYPVSIAMKKMQDIPEIRIIEGKIWSRKFLILNKKKTLPAEWLV